MIRCHTLIIAIFHAFHAVVCHFSPVAATLRIYAAIAADYFGLPYLHAIISPFSLISVIAASCSPRFHLRHFITAFASHCLRLRFFYYRCLILRRCLFFSSR